MTMKNPFLILLVGLVFSLLPPCLIATAPHKPNTMVADWVRAKMGSSSSSIISDDATNDIMKRPEGEKSLWMYQGSLYDPLDGRKIANVQGLEWISIINNNGTTILMASHNYNLIKGRGRRIIELKDGLLRGS